MAPLQLSSTMLLEELILTKNQVIYVYDHLHLKLCTALIAQQLQNPPSKPLRLFPFILSFAFSF